MVRRSNGKDILPLVSICGDAMKYECAVEEAPPTQQDWFMLLQWMNEWVNGKVEKLKKKKKILFGGTPLLKDE